MLGALPGALAAADRQPPVLVSPEPTIVNTTPRDNGSPDRNPAGNQGNANPDTNTGTNSRPNIAPIMVGPRPNPPVTAANSGTPALTGTAGKPVPPGTPGTPGTGAPAAGSNPLTPTDPATGGTTVVHNVTPSFQVIDLAVGASQEMEISNDKPASFQFTSTRGVIAIQVTQDGRLLLTGVKGNCELQLQANPVPMAAGMNEFQSLEIKGVTKFITKKVGDKIFVSLQLVPGDITITYNDKTPENQTRAKENYSFRFLIVGNAPLIIANGKTVVISQRKGLLVAKGSSGFMPMNITFRQQDSLIILTGGSLLPGPVSP